MDLLIRIFLFGIFVGILIFVIIKGNPSQADQKYFSKYFNPVPVWLVVIFIIPMMYEMLTEIESVSAAAGEVFIIWFKYVFFYATMLTATNELIYVYQYRKNE